MKMVNLSTLFLIMTVVISCGGKSGGGSGNAGTDDNNPYAKFIGQKLTSQAPMTTRGGANAEGDTLELTSYGTFELNAVPVVRGSWEIEDGVLLLTTLNQVIYSVVEVSLTVNGVSKNCLGFSEVEDPKESLGTFCLKQEETSSPNQSSGEEICESVDKANFVNAVRGVYTSKALYSSSNKPECFQSGSKIASLYIRVSTNEVKVYYRKFNNVLECQRSDFDAGGSRDIQSKSPVKLCQTKSLVEKFGSDYYYFQDIEGNYSIVSHELDSEGKTTLLKSTTTGNYHGKFWERDYFNMKAYVGR